MKNKRKKLLYISGPPCAGKTTISKELLKRVKALNYMIGDDFWLQNESYDFDIRLARTNQDIISSIEKMSLNTNLLEWVPSYGPFVDKIRNICESRGYKFTHIIITASSDVLRARKLQRDGNMDLGPVDLEKYATLRNARKYDTSVTSLESIVSECMSVLE